MSCCSFHHGWRLAFLLVPPDFHGGNEKDAARDTTFDTFCVGIGTAITTDRALLGLCEWGEAEAPPSVDPVGQSAVRMKATLVPINDAFSFDSDVFVPTKLRTSAFRRRPPSVSPQPLTRPQR